ncbi:MAG: hypothetical protein FWF81_11285 [Defluviitaleaceae bacterium]|nr:hypothetical protein [Defluviitaleaceae bacterium]
MKKIRGNAYIMVITITLFVLALLLTVLTVTALSRNITARYSDFYGLHDLAIGGNEQVLYLIKELTAQFNITLTDDVFSDEVFENFLRTGLISNGFVYDLDENEYLHTWGLVLDFEALQDRFRGVSAVRITNGGLEIIVQTQAQQYYLCTLCSCQCCMGECSVCMCIGRWFECNCLRSVRVLSRSVVNILDYHWLEMVELFRITD